MILVIRLERTLILLNRLQSSRLILPPPPKKQKTSSPCEPKDKPKNRDLQEKKTKTSPLVSKELNNLTRNELSYQDYNAMTIYTLRSLKKYLP